MRSSYSIPDSTANALGVLQRARMRIAQPEAWTQNAGARNAGNKPCSPSSTDAARWCVLGAMAAEGGSKTGHHALLRVADGDVAEFNDTHTHGQVLRLIDRGIAKLQAARS